MRGGASASDVLRAKSALMCHADERRRSAERAALNTNDQWTSLRGVVIGTRRPLKRRVCISTASGAFTVADDAKVAWDMTSDIAINVKFVPVDTSEQPRVILN